MSTNPAHEHATTNIYTKLRKWQTRIINLHPGDTCDPLVSDLLVVELIAAEGLGFHDTDTIIEYEAISYSWGMKNVDEILLCNGNELRISSHLACGLRQLRRASSARYLWVDAICINQFDEVEKARQVRNMLKIFEKAQSVVAWLGDLDPGFILFRECQGCHKCIYAQCSKEDSRHDSFGSPLSKRRRLLAVDEGRGSRIGIMSNLIRQADSSLQQPHCHEQESLEAIISRSWFSRTWVRQEVFAARNIALQLGHYQITLDQLVGRIASFCKARSDFPADLLTNRSPQNGALDPHLCDMVGRLEASMKDAVAIRDEVAEEDESTELSTLGGVQFSFATHLLSTLQTASHFDVSDPRDRVYGALGMVFHPHFKNRIEKYQTDSRYPAGLEATYPIDYRKSVSEVYQDIIRTAIHDSGTLDALFVAQDRADWAPDLPSWALDWRCAVPRLIARQNWRRYTSWERGNASAVFENDILHVLGVRRGVVENVVNPQSVCPSYNHDYTNLEDCFLRNNVIKERLTQAGFQRDCSYVLRWIRLGYKVTLGSAGGELTPMLVSSLAKQGDWAATLSDLNHQLNSDKLILLRPIDGRPGHFSCLGPAIFVRATRMSLFRPFDREDSPSFRDEPKEELERFSLL